MAQEIERKFVIEDDAWQEHVRNGMSFEQGYLAFGPEEVRVRLINGRKALLTVKGPKSKDGTTRDEWEHRIPVAAARAMLDRSIGLIQKTRYQVRDSHNDVTWEVDIYEGALKGLKVVEVELPHADHPLEMPTWLSRAREVTQDSRYGNGALARDGLPNQTGHRPRPR